MANDLKQLLRRLERLGYDVRKQKSGHYKIYRNEQLLTVSASTPGKGKRSWENLIAKLRRAGVPV